MNVLDIFCGIGGFSLGFEQNGYDVKYAIDNWKGCEKTFKVNHLNTEFILSDIYDLDSKDFKGKVDIAIGSPPCVEFSNCNVKGDPELGVKLVNEFLKWIEVINPKYWIMENVPSVVKYINNLKYHTISILNCADYGIPQNRIRCFAGKFNVPFPTHLNKRVSVFDSLKGISKVSIESKYCDAINNREYFIDKPSQTIRQIPFKWMDGKKLKQKANGQAYFSDLRTFSVREIARLQSFPDSFEFIGTKSSTIKAIGNAVPPLMSYCLAKALKNEESCTYGVRQKKNRNKMF